MRVLAVLALLLFLPPGPATAEPAAATLADALRIQVEAQFGHVPAEARVNGHVVPASSALRLLEPYPLASSDGLHTWDRDQGVGHRFGDGAFAGECLFAAVVMAVGPTLGGADPLVDRETEGAPNPTDGGATGGSTVDCGDGIVATYVVGEVGARVAPFAGLTTACVSTGPFGTSGGWVDLGPGVPCHIGDFSAANVVGHAGHLLIEFCFFLVCFDAGLLFGGLGEWGPLPAGSGPAQNDVAFVGLES